MAKKKTKQPIPANRVRMNVLERIFMGIRSIWVRDHLLGYVPGLGVQFDRLNNLNRSLVFNVVWKIKNKTGHQSVSEDIYRRLYISIFGNDNVNQSLTNYLQAGPNLNQNVQHVNLQSAGNVLNAKNNKKQRRKFLYLLKMRKSNNVKRPPHLDKNGGNHHDAPGLA